MLTELRNAVRQHEATMHGPQHDRINTLVEAKEEIESLIDDLGSFDPVEHIINSGNPREITANRKLILENNYLLVVVEEAIVQLSSGLDDRSASEAMSKISTALAACIRGKQAMLQQHAAGAVSLIEKNTFIANRGNLERLLMTLQSLLPCKELCMELLSELEKVGTVGEGELG